ncbi:MAG: DUF1232 domain-containing protein [Clostridia bacterium]|nr:DUF1232 domain-containing protein [Clostridia bacterium]
MIKKIKERTAKIKVRTITLYFVYRHPSTSKILKAYLLFIITYALSPIDLIPDFIPVLGYLDDLIILPLLILLAMKFIPESIYDECREKALKQEKLPEKFNIVSLFIILIWLVLIAYILYKTLI